MDSAEDWLRRGEALVANHAYGSAEFAHGLELLRRSAADGAIEAQVTLGNVYAQVHLLPDAPQQAVDWYRRAAEQGHPMAQDRLADLCMIGRGLSQDDAQAFRWYRRTAEQAYPHAQCHLAYMLGEGLGTLVDEIACTTWYLRAAAQGEARAYFNLALRYLAGQGAPRDTVLAAACMTNAARLQYPGADRQRLAMEATLSAADLDAARRIAASIAQNFSDLQEHLKAAPQALESAAAYRQLVEQNFESLGILALSLDAAKRPRPGSGASKHQPGGRKDLCAAPRIFTIDHFVSTGENAHLMSVAAVNFQPSQAVARDRLSQEHSAFSGHSATFHAALCDPVVRNLERRIGGAFGLPPSHVEPLSVLRYQSGDRYEAHVDYFDAARLEYNRGIGDHAGQRIASFLVYLRAPESGGETRYLKIDTKVAGRESMALCHFNCDAHGDPDPMTLHTGAAVTGGEKWLARTTLREKSFY